jgi:hypothetical protein
MWKNTVHPDRPQVTIWRMRFLHAWYLRLHTHTQTHTNTHRICNTDCVSTATAVTRKCLNVTFIHTYIHTYIHIACRDPSSQNGRQSDSTFGCLSTQDNLNWSALKYIGNVKEMPNPDVGRTVTDVPLHDGPVNGLSWIYIFGGPV